MELLDQIVKKEGLINLQDGARKYAKRLARDKDKKILDLLLVNSFARRGWMVPNQYWTAGVLSPGAIMGKYYMNYGKDFINPRKLGQLNAQRMIKELIIDNTGFCRFHRAWAEEMIPEIIGSLYGMKDKFLKSIDYTASRITSRNASVFWESEKNIDFIHSFLIKKKEIEGIKNEDLDHWVDYFNKDKHNAALDFWYEIHKGLHESLRAF